MRAQRDKRGLYVCRRRNGALGGAQLAREGGCPLEEELLPLSDARRVGLAVDELAVDLGAENVKLAARARCRFRSAARVCEGGCADVGCDGVQIGGVVSVEGVEELLGEVRDGRRGHAVCEASATLVFARVVLTSSTRVPSLAPMVAPRRTAGPPTHWKGEYEWQGTAPQARTRAKGFKRHTKAPGMRRRIGKKARPKKSGAAPVAQEPPVDDPSMMFTSDYLLDRYTFEELACAGPLPHTSQPVQPAQWSPRMLAPPSPHTPITSAPAVGRFTIRQLSKESMSARSPKLKGGVVMELGAPLDPNRSTRIPAFFQVTRMFNRVPKKTPVRAV